MPIKKRLEKTFTCPARCRISGCKEGWRSFCHRGRKTYEGKAVGSSNKAMKKGPLLGGVACSQYIVCEKEKKKVSADLQGGGVSEERGVHVYLHILKGGGR